MPVVFRQAKLSPLEALSVSAPAGVAIGVVGDDGAGKQSLLRLAAAGDPPESGEVEATRPHRYHGPHDGFDPGDALTLGLYHTLALKDATAKTRAARTLESFRRRGGTAFVVSHELELLERLSDEVWWLDEGAVRQKGHPREVLDAYRRHLATRIRHQAAGQIWTLPPSMRRGDGRAELVSVETLDGDGRLSDVWQAGHDAAVRVVVRFHEPVEDPVVGILVRTRIGFEVYGTNTELERVPLGPCRAGDRLVVTFRFSCHLCPQEYALTVASHDPDGVWHDWMEDGVALRVVDDRYTAGVACLRARVDVTRD